MRKLANSREHLSPLGWRSAVRNGFPFADSVEVDLAHAAWQFEDDVFEASVFFDVFHGVRKTRMNGLSKCTIEAREGGEDFDAPFDHLFEGHSIKRAIFIYRVHDGPRHGENGILTPQKVHVVITAHSFAFGRNLELENVQTNARFDDLVFPRIGYSKDQVWYAITFGQKGHVAPRDARGRSGKLGEYNACSQCGAKQPKNGFDRYEHVGVGCFWGHGAITDGGHGLHAEKKDVRKRTGRCGHDAITTQEVQAGKKYVCQNVCHGDEDEDDGPARIHDEVVKIIKEACFSGNRDAGKIAPTGQRANPRRG